MKRLLSFAHALADDTRLRVLHLLSQEALCVCEIADILQMPQSSVSSQIQVIKKAGLLDSEKCGKWIYYLVAPAYQPLLTSLNSFFKVSPKEIDQLRIDLEKAHQRLEIRDESCCPWPKHLNLSVNRSAH